MISIYKFPTPLQNESYIRGHKLQIPLPERRGVYPVDPYNLSWKITKEKKKGQGEDFAGTIVRGFSRNQSPQREIWMSPISYG